ncbi:MAG: carbohydrate ABC transporter permease [Euzebyales bacterium]|nr:carbohydrate ABC transporter permease [Euzebyales bacterium]MBA3621352.1 carbohydrate ABC transporter permease [Euzebyales bacterium]
MAVQDREVDRSFVPGIDRPQAATRQGRSQVGSLAVRGVFLVALLAATALFIYPLIWLLSASLKPQAEVFSSNFIGSEVRWDNYTRLFGMAPMAKWAWNSFIVTFLAASTVTISSALVAFAFAYFRFPYRKALFSVVLATMMLPGAVLMIPQFLIWDRLGMNNTLYPLWAGNLFGSAFYIFMLRQFFLTLPRELFEAANVDGAGYLRMWWSVALPLTRSSLIVVFIFELKVAWTDLVRPLIFLRDVDLFTLPRGLKAIIDNPAIGGQQQWELLAAGSVLVTVPMILVFFAFQRYFIEGIATTGSTGK